MKNNEKDKNMKKLLLALSLASSVSMAQNYKPMWQEYEKYEKDNRPASAIEVLDKIYDMALENRDFSTMLKSYLMKSDKQSAIENQNFLENDIVKLESMMKMDFGQPEKTILASLLFSYYCDYYSWNESRFEMLTAVETKELPENMDDWSREDVLGRMMYYISYVNDNVASVVDVKTGDYEQLFEQDRLGDFYGHSVAAVVLKLINDKVRSFAGELSNYYDQTSASSVLSEEDSLPVKVEPASRYDFVSSLVSLYAEVEKMYLDRNMTDAYLITEADRIYFFKEMSERYIIYQRYYVEPEESDCLSESDSAALEAYDRLLQNCPQKCDAIPYVAYMKVLVLEPYAFRRAEVLEIIDKTLKEYPESPWKNVLSSERYELTSPTLFVNAETPCPNDEISLKIESRNLSSCTVRIYKAKKGREHVDVESEKDKFLRENALLHSSHKYSLSCENEWATNKDTVNLEGLPCGRWYVLITSGESNETMPAFISLDISEYTFIAAVVDGRNELVVVDRKNGKPQGGVNVDMSDGYNFEYADTTLVTDSRGVVCMPDKYKSVQIYSGNEYKSRFDYVRFNDISVRNASDNKCKVYTDRSVYRPGQKVSVSGYVAQPVDGESYIALKDYNVDITLSGSYGLNLEMKSAQTTDEYGTFATEFQLPQHCANGMYYVQAGNSRISIRVEEYKRPTFEVKLEKPSATFTVGGETVVKGNAVLLSGAAVQNAEVKYKIERGMSQWSRWWFDNYAVIGEGGAITDEEGNFSVPVELKQAKGNNFDGFYSFRISVSVTSVAGETREEQVTLYAGERSYLVGCYIPEVIMLDSGLEFTPSVTNLANVPVSVEGRYSLIDAETGTEILGGSFSSNKENSVPSDKLRSGKFILRLEVDDNGKVISEKREVVLFSEKDTSVPVKGHMWAYQLDREISPDSPAEFMLGTSSDEAHFIMFLTDGSKTLERRDIVLHNEMRKISIPLFNENDKGLGVHIVSLNNGKSYDSAFTFKVREPDRKLTMKWEVFRDKLRPGQQEEWKMTILNPNGTPAKANVMAYMYDSSLDMIYERPVDFLIDYSRPVYLTPLHVNYNYGWLGSYIYFENKSIFHILPNPDVFLDFVYGNRGGHVFYSAQPRLMYSKSASDSFSVNSMEESVLAEDVVLGPAPVKGEQEVKIRENFAETAFFYPRLRTDAEGEVSISFTLPESMTRWHFHALAHTANMYQMQTDTMVVAAKELMVMPEIPRFVRSGDKVSVAASVVNCTENQLSGKVRFELFDPETDKVILRKEHDFETSGNETAKVSFDFDTASDCEGIGIRLVADCPTFSDGEQYIIPVLSDKVHITESVHFSVNGGETENYDLRGLFNGNDRKAANKRLTIDLTESPVWYAVEALPVLCDSDDDNAVSNMAALYANLTAQYLLTSNPELESMAKVWAESVSKSDSPLSMLERNPELKNIMLAETPWMLEAKDDAERIRRLANLFDTNNINYLSNRFIDKIAGLQMSDGSICWFKGGRGNYFMTAYVAEKLLALKSAGVQLPSKAYAVLEKAVSYINGYVADEYKRILKNGNTPVSGMMLDFAYMKARYGMEIDENSKFAYDYTLSVLPGQLKSLSLVSIAKAVVVLKDAGNSAEAERFFTSLQEYSTGNESEGLCFPSQTVYYGWGEYPVSSHVTIMQAYKAMGAGKEKIDALRLWLIRQKQTQSWDNVVATVDAVAELLTGGTDWVTDKGKVQVKLGRNVVDFESSDAGTQNMAGRYGRVYEGKELPSNIRTLTVSRDGNAPSWGAVYAQYEIPYSEVKENGSGMKISKQTFIRRIENGRELLMDPSGVEARVGDEYVSLLKISLERDMDFVHIRDRRAACAEPGISQSGYRMCGDVWTYVQQRDSSTDYFFDSLQKGEYTLQAVYRIDRAGRYTTGNAEIQCLYAPEFNAHSESGTIEVAE